MRMICFEKLCSMEGDSFINALIRFIAKRGTPKKTLSDNGTNFTRGDDELREVIQRWNDSHETQQDLLLIEIEWELNPPAAPQMGVVCERHPPTE